MSDRIAAFVDRFPWVRATDVPWALPVSDLSRLTVATISTGGVYVAGDTPFAIRDRDDVDQSYREIPVDTPSEDLRLAHEHYNKDYAHQDINVVFPVGRLQQLANDGVIGGVAPVNFSITGFIPEPEGLYETGSQIAARLKDINADCAILTPV